MSNRFDLAAAELNKEYEDPPAEFAKLAANGLARYQDTRIFGRLKHQLIAFDRLSPDEVATINLALYFPDETSSFIIWVVDLYLIRAHGLEICGWPATPFNEFPAQLKPAFDQFGPVLRDRLREMAA